jgi:hypothetical protein
VALNKFITINSCDVYSINYFWKKFYDVSKDLIHFWNCIVKLSRMVSKNPSIPWEVLKSFKIFKVKRWSPLWRE